MGWISNRKIRTLALLSLLILLATTVTYASSEGEVIISPKKLKGVTGERVNKEDIAIQIVTLSEVNNVKNFELMTETNKVITEFPKEVYKAKVVNTDTNRQMGYVTLEPLQAPKSIPTSQNQKGEFLYYQKGRVFNRLNSAEEGLIYFWRKGKTLGSRPMILVIGNIENGTFTYKDYVEVTGKEVKLIR